MYTKKTHYPKSCFVNTHEKFNRCSTNHNKKIDFYLVKYIFKLNFDKEFSPPIQSDIRCIISCFHLKMFLLHWIEYFNTMRCKFSQTPELFTTTFSNKRRMTYDFYIKQTMQLVKPKLNMINYEDKQLIYILDGNLIHPLFRKNTLLSLEILKKADDYVSEKNKTLILDREYDNNKNLIKCFLNQYLVLSYYYLIKVW